MGIVVDIMLFTLSYAYDQIVVAKDADNISYISRKLRECYKLASLNIKMIKLDYMSLESQQIKFRKE